MFPRTDIVEFKFSKDFQASHQMQLFTAKAMKNLHENVCGGIKFVHIFANRTLN